MSPCGAKVRIHNNLSKAFEAIDGLRQGGRLISLFFDVVQRVKHQNNFEKIELATRVCRRIRNTDVM